MASLNQSVRNTILAQMSSDEFQKLQPHLEPIALEMATELALRDTPLDYVIFVSSGIASMREILIRRLAIRSLFLAQNAGCNRLHNVQQRLSRWLAIVRDRLDTNVVHITHDFLSRMVGTDRASITTALAQLEGLGILERPPGIRGSLTLKNRDRLEQHSCECYQLYKRFNRELGLLSETT